MLRWGSRVVGLDAATALTRGNPTGLAAFLAHVRYRESTVTLVAEDSRSNLPLIGQAYLTSRQRTARIAFLLPEVAALTDHLPALIDALVFQMGTHGAHHLAAEVSPSAAVFEGLRRCGFAICGEQTVWKMPPGELGLASEDWDAAAEQDDLAIRALVQSSLKSGTAPSSLLPEAPLDGWVVRQRGEVRAYAHLVNGPIGLLLRLWVHPELGQLDRRLHNLLLMMQPAERKVYIMVDTHAEWVARSLDRLGGQSSESVVVMVRHLAVAQRAPALRQVLEKQREGAAAIPHNT